MTSGSEDFLMLCIAVFSQVGQGKVFFANFITALLPRETMINRGDGVTWGCVDSSVEHIEGKVCMK